MANADLKVQDQKREVALDDGRTSSTFGAAFNVFCTVVGVGLLQVSHGAKQTGWIGVIMLLVMGVMSWYTALVLIRCVGLATTVQKNGSGKQVELDFNDDGLSTESTQTATSDREGNKAVETYGDIGEVAFGAPGKWAVEGQMHITLVFVATVYNLLGGMNLVQIAPEAWDWMTQPVATIIIACLTWFHVFLKTMGEVAAVSAFNILVTLVLAVVVIAEALNHQPETPARTVFAHWDVMQLGMGFASFLGAYGVHPVLPSVYRSMKRPDQYEGMITGTFLLVVAVTLPVLCVGYYVYGDGVMAPIYETPQLAGSSLVQVMVALITVHLIGAYAILLNPPETFVETALKVEERRVPLLWRMAVRTCFVIFTCAVSLTLGTNFPPFFEFIMASTCTFTIFICPCCFYMKLRAMAGNPLSRIEIAWNVFILCASVLGTVFGTIGAVKDLIAAW